MTYSRRNISTLLLVQSLPDPPTWSRLQAVCGTETVAVIDIRDCALITFRPVLITLVFHSSVEEVNYSPPSAYLNGCSGRGHNKLSQTKNYDSVETYCTGFGISRGMQTGAWTHL
jgi:hypothetical protein